MRGGERTLPKRGEPLLIYGGRVKGRMEKDFTWWGKGKKRNRPILHSEKMKEEKRKKTQLFGKKKEKGRRVFIEKRNSQPPCHLEGTKKTRKRRKETAVPLFWGAKKRKSIGGREKQGKVKRGKERKGIISKSGETLKPPFNHVKARRGRTNQPKF